MVDQTYGAVDDHGQIKPETLARVKWRNVAIREFGVLRVLSLSIALLAIIVLSPAAISLVLDFLRILFLPLATAKAIRPVLRVLILLIPKLLQYRPVRHSHTLLGYIYLKLSDFDLFRNGLCKIGVNLADDGDRCIVLHDIDHVV